MKKILLTLLMLLIALPVFAGGEISFGKYFNGSSYADNPVTINGAEYVASVELWREIGDFTPYLEIETLMDGTGMDAFKPSSVKYFVGTRMSVGDNLTFTLERMCWHAIEADVKDQEYTLIKAAYRWE